MSNIKSAQTAITPVVQVDTAPSSHKPFKLKIVLLGDSAVGKTAFLKQLCLGNFTLGDTSTIGVDFLVKDFTDIHDKVWMRAEVWDTGGQERFKAVSPMYIRVADGLILFYDITHRNSFINIHSWIRFIEETLGEEPYVLMLIGAKADKNGRQVGKEEGQMLAKDLNALFFEVSAKTGKNIEEAFSALAKKLHHNNIEKYKREVFQIAEQNHEQREKQCGC